MRPPFTVRQRRIAHIVLSEVDWLHYAELPPDRGRGVPDLSPRQRMVLVLLLEGRSKVEISELLHISPHTTHDHTKAIYLSPFRGVVPGGVDPPLQIGRWWGYRFVLIPNSF